MKQTIMTDSSDPVIPVLLNVEQVSNMLSCSKRHVYRLVDSGRMPQPVRLGSLIRWNRAEIESWIDNGCKPVVVDRN